jgi:small neutral amino acid transporter SnatA (MarC family)
MCVAGLAVNAQSDAAEAAGAARPERVEGAWFRDGETRMDDQQHALAGLLRTIPIVESTRSFDADDAPSVWLWVIALLLALNPARAAFAIPRRSPREFGGRSPRELAAVGGAMGGLAVCTAAAVGGALLDVLDVSTPAFRLAAGIVAVVTGAADMIRRPPSPEPALTGRRAALVPVAIPVVARPALLLMALSAGADRSVLITVAAMAIGIAVMTALAGARTEGPAGRVLRWAARLLAAGLIAAGVLLGTDGVLAV